MEFSSPNDAGGGGGGGHHGGRAPSPASGSSSSGTTTTTATRQQHDSGRSQPDPAGSAGQQHPVPPPPAVVVVAPPVLSLDQIRVNCCSNEYTDGPAVAQRSPASGGGQRGQQKSDPAVASVAATRTNERRETPEERPNNLRNLVGNAGAAALLARSRDGSLRSSGTDDSSQGGGAVNQGLLSGPAALLGEQIIRTQPKHAGELSPDELKPLNDASAEAAQATRPLVTVPGGGGGSGGRHPRHHLGNRCEDCGRCRCAECRRPEERRPLPSCWLCGRRCVCSADTAVDYGTCACCVKGLFYHCSSDDEDTCADKPFSCRAGPGSHCCARWAAVSLLALVLPCLLCYLPAKGCLAACTSCYNCATAAARPGCRCKGGGRGARHASGGGSDKPA